MEYYLAVKRNKSLLQETTRGGSQKYYSERKMPDTKEYIPYDFILMKFNNRQN